MYRLLSPPLISGISSSIFFFILFYSHPHFLDIQEYSANAMQFAAGVSYDELVADDIVSNVQQSMSNKHKAYGINKGT